MAVTLLKIPTWCMRTISRDPFVETTATANVIHMFLQLRGLHTNLWLLRVSNLCTANTHHDYMCSAQNLHVITSCVCLRPVTQYTHIVMGCHASTGHGAVSA